MDFSKAVQPIRIAVCRITTQSSNAGKGKIRSQEYPAKI